MKTGHHDQNGLGKNGSGWKWGLCGFLAIIAFFLWAEHRAHLFGILPYLLLAACPLMHLFMRHDHGGDRKDSGSDRPSDPQSKP